MDQYRIVSLLLSSLILVTYSSSQIAVVKYWSIAVSQDGTAKLACKANNGAQIRLEIMSTRQKVLKVVG